MDAALSAFSAAEANLEKLERLWTEIEQMLPSIGSLAGVDDEAAYREKARAFRHILAEMPVIDGHAIRDELPDPDGLQSTALDVLEVDEPSATISYDQSLHRQGEILADYRFRMKVKRKALVRDELLANLRSVDDGVARMSALLAGEPKDGDLIPHRDALRDAAKTIDALLGSDKRPSRWGDFLRHLHFGMLQDFRDIVNLDWPANRRELEQSLYGESEPLPVAVKDLGAVVASRPTGPVTTALKWEALDAEGFERLIFNLLDRQQGWENPQWLTKTNAPDRGRDLSVTHVLKDPLAGTTRRRVIVACRNRRLESMNPGDVAGLAAQMNLWAPPRVDVLIIATSGRFSDGAVDWIEKHNQEDRALRIEMWPDSHLERLLAERPALAATFHLR